MKEKYMKDKKLEKKVDIRKVIVCVVMAIVVAIAGLVMYSEKVHKIGFIEGIKQAINEQINSNNGIATQSDTTTVDVTGIEPGDIGNHTCSEYYISKYDETNHWNECKICGKVYDKVAHSFVDNGWTMGSADICIDSNLHRFSCNCGYNYSSIDGRKSHRIENENVMDTCYVWKHCSDCLSVIDREYCYKSDGTKITCTNPGRCALCGYDYTATAPRHFMGVNFNVDNIPMNEPMESEVDENGDAYCASCHEYLAHINYNYLEKVSDTVFKYHTSINVPNGAAYTGYRIEGSSAQVATIQNNPTINGNTWSNITTITMKQKVEMNLTIAFIYDGRYNGRDTVYYFMSDFFRTDEEAPVILSINQDEDTPWEKTKEIAIIGTENYCSSVNVEILYGENVIYTGTAAVDETSRNWSIVATPELEASIEGKKFTVRVTDPCENSSTQEFTVTKVDSIAPEATESEIVIGGDWAKEKSYTFGATDSGIGNVSIAFNDLAQYGVASVDGTTYSREYKFVGDVYSPREAVVYYKDELDNLSSQTIVIDKLDNTKPTIVEATIKENVITANAHDRHETEGEGSGIVKYRYMISRDKLNNPLITESNSVEIDAVESFTIENLSPNKYVYMVAIDRVGNVSDVYTLNVNYDLNLETEVNLGAANGHGGVDLSWSGENMADAIFKAYQKKEGSEEWESISTVDLYKKSAEPIKVLNVYPTTLHPIGNGMAPYTVTFTYLDGTSANLPKSAALKVWMEGGTMNENGTITEFESYGKNPITGQQLLEVTPVSAQTFNSNPEIIWNYDVVMFGTWDVNGGITDQPDNNAIKEIERYIKAGYGIISGHDSLGAVYYDIGLCKLRKYFNIDQGSFQTGEYKLTDPNMVDYMYNWAYASSIIEVTKNGLLTNFPYELPLGTKLTVPLTHTINNAANGNLWMTLIDGTDMAFSNGSINNYYNAGGKGSPVYYLTTYNNTAMIQTGHSNCESTADERKVLANTLFYLKQRTTAKSFTDNSGQDLKAPNAPEIQAARDIGNNNIKVTFNSDDNGSTYSYYVQAYDENDTSILLATSNERTETVTTGTRGYYYVIDNNPDNHDFDIYNATFTTEKSLDLDISNNGKYIHMKAIDNAGRNYTDDNGKFIIVGNVSEPTVVKIEEKSTATIKLNGGAINGATADKTRQEPAGSTIDLGAPTRDGYTFKGWECSKGTISGNNYTFSLEDDVINAIWDINQYDYTIEYYYNGAKDESMTERGSANFGSVIDSYIDKVKNGYKFEKVLNKPISVSSNSARNVMQVYYITDETQTKTLEYTVEYYKGTEKVVKDTQLVNQTVQYLQPSTLTVVKSQINTVDKYSGYKLKEIKVNNNTVNELPATVNNGDVIRVYFDIDDNQRKTLSYTVEYYLNGSKQDKDTQTETESVQLLAGDIITVDKSKINTTNKYRGYRLSRTAPTPIPDSVYNGDVIKVYYVIDDEQRKDLSYTVQYFKDGVRVGEDTQVETANVQLLDPDVLPVNKNKINIVDKYYGYKYDAERTGIIPTSIADGSIINIYYVTDESQTKELRYTVEYYKDGVRQDDDTQNVKKTVQVLENDEIAVNRGDIDISSKYVGYKFDKLEKNTDVISIVPSRVETGTVLKVYYVIDDDQTKSIKYTVEYYKDNEKVDEQVVNKTVQVLAPSVLTVDKSAINITDKYDGYKLDDLRVNDRIIADIPDSVNHNDVIKVYYAKRTDLSYTVKYFDVETKEEIHVAQTFDKQEFDSVIIGKDVAIEIDGYVYDYTDPSRLTIKSDVSRNITNVYYTKMTGLSYTINYLDKDTGDVIYPADKKGSQVFGTVIKAEDNEIAIDGYNYDSCSVNQITIGTDNTKNVINMYYTKKTDLSYEVNYLEKGTNKVIETKKIKGGKTLYDVVNSVDERIAINGYNYDSAEKESITIGADVTKNVIKLYYTKRNDLTYTVNYLEKGSGKVLQGAKVVNTAVFESVINASNEVIGIDGYNYDSADKNSITIGTDASKNVINLYYTKKNDLEYTINYLEKDTNKVLETAKVVKTAVFESVVNASAEVISINGYNYDSADKDSMVIGTGSNVMNLYYTKKNDLVYTVNYLEKDTNKVLQGAKVVSTAVFDEVILSANEVISIDGYNYDSCDKDSMKITTGVNVINLYYTKKNNLVYTVNYLEKGTNKELEGAKVVNTATFEEVINSVDEVINIAGYDYDSAEVDSITIKADASKNIINLYYTKRTDLSFTVNYVDQDTNKPIDGEVPLVVGNQVFEAEISASTVVKAIDGYVYRGCVPDKIKISADASKNIITMYYTKRNDLSYTVNYLELDTNKEIRASKTVGNKIFGEQINAADEKVDITGYKFDSYSIDVLTIGTGSNVINIYYTVDDEQVKELSYTVEYYKDGVRQDDDTQVETGIVQVLQNKVRVDKSKINITNKYVAYKLNAVATGTIPDEVENGTVIKVYYIRNTEKTGYIIDYYYNGMRDGARRESVEANVGDIITRATIADKISKNMKDGYRLLTVGNVPLTTGYDLNKDIIKVFYTTTPEPIVGYTIEYYYDGVRDNSLTEAGEANVGDVITKANIISRINANLKDGYEYLSIANDPLTIVENTEQNVIKVYYKTETKTGPGGEVIPNDDSGYTIEYHYNYVRDNLRSEVVETEPNIVVTQNDIQAKIDLNKLPGYKVIKVENVPITTGHPAENNIIKVYYVNENSTNVGYTIEYYYDFIKDNRKTEFVSAAVGEMITNDTIADKVKNNAGYGYRLLRVLNTPLRIMADVENNVIKVYYVSKTTPENEVGYTLEYYYDYVKENARSEMVKAKVGDYITKETIADKITANTKSGYKFLTAANLPMTIEYDVENNVIKVYYTKRNDSKLAYSIEYYYDEVRYSDLTEVIAANKDDIITKTMVQGKANANATAKEGYRLSEIVNTPLTITEDVDDNVIKVFYIKDTTTGPSGEKIPNPNTGYSIEYYYDGVKRNRLTDGIESPIGDVITREAIEDRIIKNTLPGYSVLQVLNVPLTVQADPDSNVIKVYYTSKATNGYSIEYYYDYMKDNTRTELFNANVGDVIGREDIAGRITANTKSGYKLLTVTNTPITIVSDVDRNVIKVYYIRSTTPTEQVGYTIEYYYDNVRDNRLTETNQTIVGSVITNETIDNKVKANAKNGFSLLRIVNTPLTIGQDTDNNVIKVYYSSKADNGYTIEYYYEYVKDNTKTEFVEARLGDIITNGMISSKITANTKVGYKFLIAINVPLEIEADLDENAIKVYYINERSSKVGYTLEYYYDGVRKNSLSEEISAAKGDVITRAMVDGRVIANTLSGYRLQNVVNVPLTVTEDVPENIIKVYYISDSKPQEDIGYSIEYYFNGIKKNSLTEMVDANIGEVITDSDIADKIEAHKPANLIRVAVLGTPLTISENVDDNVIRVYYVVTPTTDAERVKYQIKYHYDGVINSSKTSIVDDIRGNVIDNSMINRYVQDNMTTGYRLEKIDNTPIVLTENINENVIEVYYVKRTDLSYRVEYLEQGTNIRLAGDKVVDNQTFGDIVREDAINIDGYEKVNPVSKTISIKVDENVITFYYTKRADLTYKVNYLERSTGKVVSREKVVNGQVYGAVIEEKAIDVAGYNLDDVNTKTITIGIEENVINFYYTKRDDLRYTVKFYEEGTTNEIATEEIVTGVEFETVVDSNTKVKPIDGYSFKRCDPESLIVGVDESKNVINIYYSRVEGLTYTVNYVEKGDESNILHPANIVDKQVYGTTIKAADEVIAISGYNYDSASEDIIISTDVSKNVINIYYTRKTDLSYTVNYLEQGSNTILANAKVVGGQTLGNKITETAIDIDGYVKPVTDTQTITIEVTDNVINFYYTKRTDLSYTVNYLEKDTNKVLTIAKIVSGKTFGEVITSSNEIITINGYNYDSVDNRTITIGTGVNVINVYYTKRSDLSYTINYLEKDTNTVLKAQKVVNNVEFDTEVTIDAEKVTIDGYVYDSAVPDKFKVGTDLSKNVMNIYYTKRGDLIYTVNYLDVETGDVLHPTKVEGNQVLGAKVDSSTEVITIDGYNFDTVDKTSITIGTGENVINIYYSKRNDLSYTINFLEKDTNEVLHIPVIMGRQTFGAIVSSNGKDIAIDGYNFDSADKRTITIGTNEEENVFNLYYTKRTNLGYKVNYIERETDKVLAGQKVVSNKTFGEVIVSETEVITINGYAFDGCEKDEITIGTGENVIIVYYTKVNGLSYTVKYVDKDTDETIHAPKTEGNQTFEATILARNERIEIDGYVYDSCSKDRLVIGTGVNELTLYYIKRSDLSYKVNYIEKGTGNVIKDTKTVNGMTYKDEVYAEDELIDIDGYYFDSYDKEKIIITTGENVINMYYTRRTDLSYVVNYLEKGTNKGITGSKTVVNMNFGDIVESKNDVIEIYGYRFDSADKETLTITTGENVINLYYIKKDTKVTVHFYEEGTTTRVSNDVTIEGKVFDRYEATAAEDVASKYELIAVPENSIGKMTEEEIVVTFYYRKKATKVIVHFYEEGTTNKLSENVVIEGRVDDRYTTTAATDVPSKYELSITPDNATGSMTEEIIEVTYFYRVKDTTLNIRYLEQGTNIELATPERQSGKVEEDYITDAKPIEGYTLVGDSGNTTGKLTIAPITVTFYYLQNTSVEVNHIDKNTNETLEKVTVDGLVGDKYTANAKNIENYVLVERPRVETVTMGKDKIILNYYYVHVSAGVIEKHVDVITGDILYNATHEGNEGDAYDIREKTFEGYDLVREKLPANARGTMTINPIEVVYYYKYRTSVTAEYVDKVTNKKLASDIVINGYEADSYITERKEFDNYKLVEVPENSEGKMTKEAIKVRYEYLHKSEGVEIKYIDEATGKELDKEEIPGYETDGYETEPKPIPGYDVVKDKLPENSDGEMTVDKIIVEYYYIKQSSVTAKYIDKITGDEIAEEVRIDGHQNDKYELEAKEIEGYDLVEEPENAKGIMGANPSEVIYEYHRPARVVVNYIDVDTNEEIIEPEIIEGHQDDPYETEAKEIKYYNLVEDKLPKNAKGKMTVMVTRNERMRARNEIVDDETIVNYYYKKMEFSIKVDKIIDRVVLNGQALSINGDIGKVEINKKDLANAKLQIIYTIRVANNGELAGKATLLEKLPSGTTMSKANNQLWEISGATATMTTEEIKPGETKEYTVILDWTNSEGNVGNKENKVDVLKTENEAGFEEGKVDLEDSEADLVISISTGSSTYMIATGMAMIVLAGISVVLVKKTKEEN